MAQIPLRATETLAGLTISRNQLGGARPAQATEGAGTGTGAGGGSPHLHLPFSLWATVLPPQWGTHCPAASRLTSSKLHEQGSGAPSCSCRGRRPREGRVLCTLAGAERSRSLACDSGLERAVGPWAGRGVPTPGGHSPTLMQNPSCQPRGRNRRSLSQKRPQQRTRVKGKSCQVGSLSLDGDPFFQRVPVVSLL